MNPTQSRSWAAAIAIFAMVVQALALPVPAARHAVDLTAAAAAVTDSGTDGAPARPEPDGGAPCCVSAAPALAFTDSPAPATAPPPSARPGGIVVATVTDLPPAPAISGPHRARGPPAAT